MLTVNQKLTKQEEIKYKNHIHGDIKTLHYYDHQLYYYKFIGDMQYPSQGNVLNFDHINPLCSHTCTYTQVLLEGVGYPCPPLKIEKYYRL